MGCGMMLQICEKRNRVAFILSGKLRSEENKPQRAKRQ